MAAMNTRDKRIWITVVCLGTEGKAHFHLLGQDLQAIENEIGYGLVWER